MPASSSHPASETSAKRHVLKSRISPLAAVAAVAAATAISSVAFANTAKEVVNGQTDLTLDASYNPVAVPSASDDALWAVVNYSPSTFTVSGTATVNYGTLNDLATNAITIQNGTATTTASLVLNGGANSVAPNTSDLLYVPSGSALTIQNGTGTLGLTLAGSASGMNMNVGGSVTISSAVTAASGSTYTKTGIGTLTFVTNNLTTNLANMVVAAGTLVNAQTSALGAGTLTLGVSGGGDASIIDGANVNLTNNITVAAGVMGTLRLGGGVPGQTPTFTGITTLLSGANVTMGSGGSSTNGVRFSSIIGDSTNTLTIDGGASNVQFGTANGTLTSPIQVISGALQNSTSNGTGGTAAGGGGTVTLGGSAGSATATLLNLNTNFNNNIVIASGGTGIRRIAGNANRADGVSGTYRGALSVNADVMLGFGNPTGTNNANGMNYGGGISGTNTITIDAGTNPTATFQRGYVNLTGTNTGFTGNVNISTGDLRVGGANALNNTSITVAIASGARLDLTGGAATIAGLNDATGTGGTVTVNSANTRLLTLGGSGSYAFSGVLENGAGTLQLTKSGSGIQTLSGANTFSGLTTINGGTLKFGNASALGTSAVTLGIGGALDLNGFVPANAFTGNATRGILSNTGAAVDLSATTLSNSGSFAVGGTGAITLGNVSGGAGNAIVKNGANTLTLAGANDNSFLVATVNAGMLVLAKPSDGSVHAVGATGGGQIGLTINNGGTVQLAGSGGDQIWNSAGVAFNGGVLDLNGRSESVSHLTSAGGTLSSATPGGSLAANSFAHTGGTFTINSGTTLSTGSGTAVSAGTVVVNGTMSGTTTVNGGTLKGVGSMGLLTMNSGGEIAPGNSIGTLATAGLSLAGTGVFALEVNTNTQASDLINVAGDFSLDLSNSAGLSIADLGSNVALAAGTTFTFVDYTGVWNGGLFTFNSAVVADDATFTIGANTYALSYNGTSGADTAVTLQVVPEPASCAILVGGLGMVLGLRRNRRRH